MEPVYEFDENNFSMFVYWRIINNNNNNSNSRFGWKLVWFSPSPNHIIYDLIVVKNNILCSGARSLLFVECFCTK